MIGLIGKKLGMTRTFQEDGRSVPVTVIQAGPCVVTQVKDLARDGYSAIQLGFGAKKAKNTPLPMQGHFRKAGSDPLRTVHEFRLDEGHAYKLGQTVGVAELTDVVRVDVTGVTKGKGTAGVMKRHGFHGLRASHGVHRKHRSPGSIGACATPGHVFKGTRMAGRMGVEKVTVQNLTIHAVDAERGLILVKGSVPGPKGALVVLRTAAKKGVQA